MAAFICVVYLRNGKTARWLLTNFASTTMAQTSGPSLEPQRWFASEFAKLRIYRKPREEFPKIVQGYLYDTKTIEQRLVNEENIQQLGENISADNSTTYASWLKYQNSVTLQSLPWRNFLSGFLPFSKSIKGYLSRWLRWVCLQWGLRGTVWFSCRN